jgi:hypothetical protein
MYPWLWFWSPQFHFPWSGSVAQQIEPNTNWFFDSIAPEAGNGKIEKKAFEVASYGRQLGLITEVVIELTEQAKPLSPEATASLERLKSIESDIRKIKAEDLDSFAREIEGWLHSLRQTNGKEFARLSSRLRPLLEATRA